MKYSKQCAKVAIRSQAIFFYLLFGTCCNKPYKPHENCSSLMNNEAHQHSASKLVPFLERYAGVEAKIRAFTTPLDFKTSFDQYETRTGLWDLPKDDMPLIMNWFFEAWFDTDPEAAIAAVSRISNSDGEMCRIEAIMAGIEHSPELIDKYVEAATSLFSNNREMLVLNSIYSTVYDNDPDALIQYAETALGQGRTKQMALTAYFTNTVSTDFRLAIQQAQKLTFDEDKTTAYNAIFCSIKTLNQKDYDWAIAHQTPNKYTSNVRIIDP